MPVSAYYQASISEFRQDNVDRILGVLTSKHHHAVDEQERFAWIAQIAILQSAVSNVRDGRIFLEFSIPRMGKRADTLLVLPRTVVVLEFKVGATEYTRSGFEQVEDYALDLKNFHEGSHQVPIVPVLVATHAPFAKQLHPVFASDNTAKPLATNAAGLSALIAVIEAMHDFPSLNFDEWSGKGYKPTPTIVEAAQVLYRTHRVDDIARSDAGATNLRELSDVIDRVVHQARRNETKSICFVTGVPGSGKTLAGLHIATKRSDAHREEHAVFLSGNGPLVDVLREALARDSAKRDGISKGVAQRRVCSFIQNIHHFRDQYLGNQECPIDNVVIFDEAQRAWTREQTASFMKRKRGRANFDMSEPEFLISVMDRHVDWCTIVCLVGGGQEINTGEAGISEWMRALQTRFREWQVYVSPRITLPEYAGDFEIDAFLNLSQVRRDEHLHLSVSLRSFRAEALSDFVGHLLSNDAARAKAAYEQIQTAYPICLTRDLAAARAWLRTRARGTERCGLVASSGALRLRPEGIYIKAPIEPKNWFLNDSDDVRSSYYLEDVATEFAVQGLELDWAGVLGW